METMIRNAQYYSVLKDGVVLSGQRGSVMIFKDGSYTLLNEAEEIAKASEYVAAYKHVEALERAKALALKYMSK